MNSNDPDLQRAEPSAETSETSWILWPFLLPLALGAGIIFLQVQPPTVPDETTPEIATTRVRPRQPQPEKMPIPAMQYSIPSTILVVGDDAKLHQKPFKNVLPANNGANLSAIHTAWINAVIAAEPTMFPAGTRVKSVKVGSDAEPAIVDFNAAFNAPDFWQGETKTKLAIYSIVNTLAPVMSPKGRDVAVQITVEGKRLQTLGEFDISDAIPADYSLNSSSSQMQTSGSRL